MTGMAPRAKTPTACWVARTPAASPEAQAAVDGNGHDEDVDDVVAHASPVVDADEVPEGGGALGLLDEDLGPHLCGLVPLPGLGLLVPAGAEGLQAYFGGPVVEEPSQQEHYRAARYAGEPEDPLHSKAVEGCADEEKQSYGAHSLEGPDDPHGDSEASPEPQGDAGDGQDTEHGGGNAEDHAEEEVELPEVGHDAGEHHAEDE